MSKGLLVVFSGPSGVGKGTVLKEVFERDSNLVYSVSCTTRQPRPGEVDGIHYHFISADKFEQNIKDEKMLEYAVYCGNYYGTGAEYVEMQRSAGKDVVLEIETQGALQVMAKRKDAITVFIAPPSFKELEDRLKGRATENEAVINQRITKAKEEFSHMQKYKYVVINDVVETAAEDILSILRAERIKNNKLNYKF